MSDQKYGSDIGDSNTLVSPKDQAELKRLPSIKWDLDQMASESRLVCS